MPRLPSVLPEIYAQYILPNCSKALYQDETIRLDLNQQQAYLLFCSESSAGAIGKTQGESFAKALQYLEMLDFKALTLLINSAGAHFSEPMEGLLALNALLENLWRLRIRNVRIQVVCDGWLYGGMGMLVAAVAHEVLLTPHASWGLLGSRVTGERSNAPIPVETLKASEASDFSLKRASMAQLVANLQRNL